MVFRAWNRVRVIFVFTNRVSFGSCVCRELGDQLLVQNVFAVVTRVNFGPNVYPGNVGDESRVALQPSAESAWHVGTGTYGHWCTNLFCMIYSVGFSCCI